MKYALLAFSLSTSIFLTPSAFATPSYCGVFVKPNQAGIQINLNAINALSATKSYGKVPQIAVTVLNNEMLLIKIETPMGSQADSIVHKLLDAGLVKEEVVTVNCGGIDLELRLDDL